MRYADGLGLAVLFARSSEFAPDIPAKLLLYGALGAGRIAILGGLMVNPDPRYPLDRRPGSMVFRTGPAGRVFIDRVPSECNIDGDKKGERLLWLSDQGGHMPAGVLAYHAGNAVFRQVGAGAELPVITLEHTPELSHGLKSMNQTMALRTAQEARAVLAAEMADGLAAVSDGNAVQ